MNCSWGRPQSRMNMNFGFCASLEFRERHSLPITANTPSYVCREEWSPGRSRGWRGSVSNNRVHRSTEVSAITSEDGYCRSDRRLTHKPQGYYQNYTKLNGSSDSIPGFTGITDIYWYDHLDGEIHNTIHEKRTPQRTNRHIQELWTSTTFFYSHNTLPYYHFIGVILCYSPGTRQRPRQIKICVNFTPSALHIKYHIYQ